MTYEMRTDTITFAAALRDIDSEKARVRMVAADALGDVVEPDDRAKAVHALIGALQDPSAGVRSEAALSLGDLESEAAVAPLCACMDDGAPLVRQSAVIALGRLGFASSFDEVADRLAHGAPDVRFVAATSLVEIDPARASPHLIRALDDSDSEVVAATAIALGAVGDTSAIEPLRARLDAWSDNARTQFDLGYALAQLGHAPSMSILTGYVDHKDLAWDAIDALERLGDERAIDAMTPLMSRILLSIPIKLRAAAAILTLLGAPRASSSASDSDAWKAARRCLVGGLSARKLDHRGLAVQLLTDVGDESVTGDLHALRKRRAGRHLREEIEEALARIAARSTPQTT